VEKFLGFIGAIMALGTLLSFSPCVAWSAEGSVNQGDFRESVPATRATGVFDLS
jgi:hypothetical protein